MSVNLQISTVLNVYSVIEIHIEERNEYRIETSTVYAAILHGINCSSTYSTNESQIIRPLVILKESVAQNVQTIKYGSNHLFINEHNKNKLADCTK